MQYHQRHTIPSTSIIRRSLALRLLFLRWTERIFYSKDPECINRPAIQASSFFDIPPKQSSPAPIPPFASSLQSSSTRNLSLDSQPSQSTPLHTSSKPNPNSISNATKPQCSSSLGNRKSQIIQGRSRTQHQLPFRTTDTTPKQSTSAPIPYPTTTSTHFLKPQASKAPALHPSSPFIHLRHKLN